MKKTIWIKKVKYYYYQTYEEWEEVYDEIKYQKKQDGKNKYFVIKTEEGFWFPMMKYHLYFTRVRKIW